MVAAGARPRTPALFLVVVVSVATGCGSNTSSTPAEETSSSVATSTTSSPSYAEPTNSLPGGGRVLFNLERSGKPSQPAYIDETGIHIIPVAPDPTLAHVAWASERSMLFDTERSGPRHIHRIDIDGSDDVQLTTGPESQIRASLSPDGSAIVYGDYVTGSGHDLGLHAANADGTNVHALTRPAPAGSKSGDDGATFSPDGQWIAYYHATDFDKGTAGVWIMRADGSNARQLTADTTSASYPRWSPDGKQILFTENGDDRASSPHGLWIVDVDGGPPRPLMDVSDPGASSEGDWSPDGNSIVFKYFRDGWDHNELRLVDTDGTDMRTLWVSPPGRTAETPDWGN